MTGERAERALVREIHEELGMLANVGCFLGAVEHMWREDAADNHEINLLFDVEVDGLTSGEAPLSREPHIEFLWIPTSKLADANLQPAALIDLMHAGSRPVRVFWASSLPEE